MKISELINELTIILKIEGDLDVYLFDEYDRAQGHNTLDIIEIKAADKKRPKRIEFA